jgi:hypothetical protein
MFHTHLSGFPLHAAFTCCLVEANSQCDFSLGRRDRTSRYLNRSVIATQSLGSISRKFVLGDSYGRGRSVGRRKPGAATGRLIVITSTQQLGDATVFQYGVETVSGSQRRSTTPESSPTSLHARVNPLPKEYAHELHDEIACSPWPLMAPWSSTSPSLPLSYGRLEDCEHNAVNHGAALSRRNVCARSPEILYFSEVE